MYWFLVAIPFLNTVTLMVYNGELEVEPKVPSVSFDWFVKPTFYIITECNYICFKNCLAQIPVCDPVPI